MPSEPVIGWDVGGAHLKGARLDGSGRVEQVVLLPCPLWQGLDRLDQALSAAAAALGDSPAHAVTMTGEMVDLFASRMQGVAAIVSLMDLRFPGARFYRGSGDFLPAAQCAGAEPALASANWKASAELVAARIPAALFVDVGSTTTDIAPVRDGRLQTFGCDDASRLRARELVYTGVTRTPVMALAAEVAFEGASAPLMAELFATAADIHRLCGRLPAEADLYDAADGGEKDEPGSARRLARMIGREVESRPLEVWRQLARSLAAAQTERIARAAELVLERAGLPPGAPLVSAGVGRFLIGDLAGRLDRPCVEFAELLPDPGPQPGRVTDCAAAVAVAWLSRARGGGGPPPE